MFIYKTTNLINGKIYIGKKIKDIKGYLGSGVYLKKAIEKYGKENFKRDIIEDNIDDRKILSEREKYWISYYNSKDKNIGYNLTDGGDGLNNPTEETREKISIGNKGKTVSEKVKIKISNTLKGTRSGENHPQFGTKAKEKTKKLMSDIRIGISTAKNPTSNYIGVCWDGTYKKWSAEIRKDSKKFWLGYFSSEEEAALAWNVKAIELGVPESRLNIIDNKKE